MIEKLETIYIYIHKGLVKQIMAQTYKCFNSSVLKIKS